MIFSALRRGVVRVKVKMTVLGAKHYSRIEIEGENILDILDVAVKWLLGRT